MHVLEYWTVNFISRTPSSQESTIMVTTKPFWLEDLETNGFAVVPNAIPQQACDEFIEEAWEWLESFPYGFRRDDRSTWTSEHLPHGPTGGLYNRYSVNHEAFVWKIRM
jgi:hypothetical protein